MPIFLGKILAATGLVVGSVFMFLTGSVNPAQNSQDIIIKKEILTGSTFSIIASQAGVATDTVSAILEDTKRIYDLSSIRAGKELVFKFDEETNVLKELDYDIDTEETLIIKNISTTTEEWRAEKKLIDYKIETSTAEGVIDSSLYETMVSQGLDDRLAIALAEAFAWQIDFVGDIQKGDSFKVIYEKRFLDGNYAMPGKILAAKFNNAGQEYLGYYFKDSDGKEGYYDENGKSLQKVFLKSPLQYKYISSGFSYKRVNPVTGGVGAHRALDLAANYNTPVVSIGEGTVIQAGWNGAYGISVKVRHNDTYSTVYGHLSSLARGIKKGASVRQGQVIGYVGSTGQSTGSHLHYEMLKFGGLINPFNVVVPDGKPIADSDEVPFGEVKKQFADLL
ncbi:MAG: peptidoglycan DD-metalloendopeptidase family protein [bacterium]|nr:peptidoglycan DD-metalloendopeptidase family protein [bacterium]